MGLNERKFVMSENNVIQSGIRTILIDLAEKARAVGRNDFAGYCDEIIANDDFLSSYTPPEVEIESEKIPLKIHETVNDSIITKDVLIEIEPCYLSRMLSRDLIRLASLK